MFLSPINTIQVDATVLEVGVGGMYDSTNIVPKPIVTGVTALGLDHIAVLGKTLTEIGWQKGGIYKVSGIVIDTLGFRIYFPVSQPGVPAYTVEQLPEGLAALEQQAKDRGVWLIISPDDWGHLTYRCAGVVFCGSATHPRALDVQARFDSKIISKRPLESHVLNFQGSRVPIKFTMRLSLCISHINL